MTIHRALGFVDRANLTDTSPLRVVMASEGRQADGIDLRMSGAQLERYRGNPVLGYGHSYYGRQNLPIGRVDPGSLAVEGTQLAGNLEFDEGDPFAVEVERKVRAGYLNAVSIGFDVTEWESEADNYWRGGVATGWELSELSVVPVPMDAAALVTSGRSLNDPDMLAMLRSLSESEFDRLLQRVRALDEASAGQMPRDLLPAAVGFEINADKFVELLRRAIVSGAPKNIPAPSALEINPDAARGLLAAFAPKEIG